jgi:hypothetical protein
MTGEKYGAFAMRRFWITAAVALAAAGCSGTRLTGGDPDSGGESCTTANGCLRGSGGIVGLDGGSAGGSGGTGGQSCDQLVAAHTVALTKALACTPAAPNQCHALAQVVPLACPTDACENYQYVNDNTQVNALLLDWIGACPPNGFGYCPNGVLACGPHAQPSICVPTSPGASTGTCMPSPHDGGLGLAPDGGESCDQLAADYSGAVRAALACTPGAPNQCQARISPNLTPCDNDCATMEAANDATGATAAWQRWATRCVGLGVCTLANCNPPSGQVGVCVPIDGGIPTGGICVNSTPTD